MVVNLGSIMRIMSVVALFHHIGAQRLSQGASDWYMRFTDFGGGSGSADTFQGYNGAFPLAAPKETKALPESTQEQSKEPSQAQPPLSSLDNTGSAEVRPPPSSLEKAKNPADAQPRLFFHGNTKEIIETQSTPPSQENTSNATESQLMLSAQGQEKEPVQAKPTLSLRGSAKLSVIPNQKPPLPQNSPPPFFLLPQHKYDNFPRV